MLKRLYYRKVRLLDRVHIPVSTKRPFNVGTILGHCRSRCANVEQTFEECFVFAVLYVGPHISIPANTIYETIWFQCWASVEDVGPALKQHLFQCIVLARIYVS